jgi:hypothetical protein
MVEGKAKRWTGSSSFAWSQNVTCKCLMFLHSVAIMFVYVACYDFCFLAIHNSNTVSSFLLVLHKRFVSASLLLHYICRSIGVEDYMDIGQ